MRDGPLAPRRRRAGATIGRSPATGRARLPPVTGLGAGILGALALGAAGLAVVRDGRTATLLAFAAAQLAVGLVCLVAGLVVLGIAQLLLGGVAQLVLLAPAAAPSRAVPSPAPPPRSGWVGSWPAATAAAGLLGLIVAAVAAARGALAHPGGAGPGTGHTLLLGYAVPVLLAVVLVVMVAAIGVAVAQRDVREAAEAALALAHRRRLAAQRARAAQRAAARAARRGTRP